MGDRGNGWFTVASDIDVRVGCSQVAPESKPDDPDGSIYGITTARCTRRDLRPAVDNPSRDARAPATSRLHNEFPPHGSPNTGVLPLLQGPRPPRLMPRLDRLDTPRRANRENGNEASDTAAHWRSRGTGVVTAAGRFAPTTQGCTRLDRRGARRGVARYRNDAHTGRSPHHCPGVLRACSRHHGHVLPSLDEITPLDPAAARVVADDSPRYRRAKLWLESTLRKTPVLLGAHQLTVANEMLSDPLEYQRSAVYKALDPANLRPHILIADAVGLGKTIEIGMILAELVRPGRGERILIVTYSSRCNMRCGPASHCHSCASTPSASSASGKNYPPPQPVQSLQASHHLD